MASWHDKRRQIFFDLVRNHPSAADQPVRIREDRDNGDDVLYVDRRVYVEPVDASGDDLDALRAALTGLGAELPDGGAVVNLASGARPAGRKRPAADDCPVSSLVGDHGAHVAPEYVLISQQHVQPGEDPEAGAPLPPIAPDDHRGRGVTIAIVDTGLSDQKPVRAEFVAAGVTPKLAPTDVDPLYHERDGVPYLDWAAGHGTFIASIAHQVAPGARLLAVRACSSAGFESEANVAAGIDRAVDLGADIINLSWATYGFARPNAAGEGPRCFVPPRLLHQAICRAQAKGVLVVAAAGNSASTDPMYPAAFDEVIGVAALDRDGRRWDHSNYGDWVQASALGVNVRGLYVKGDEDPANDPDGVAESWQNGGPNYATWSGTSFAAPLVAAQIAVVASARDCTPADAWDLLRDVSRDAPDMGCGVRVLVDLPGQI